MLDTSWNWGKTKWIWELGQVTGSRQLDMLDCTLQPSRNTSFSPGYKPNRIYFYSILSSWMLEHSNAETIKTSWRCSDKVQERKLLQIATNIPPSSQKKFLPMWKSLFFVQLLVAARASSPKSMSPHRAWPAASKFQIAGVMSGEYLSSYGEIRRFLRFFQVMGTSTEHPHRIHFQQSKRTSRQLGFLY